MECYIEDRCTDKFNQCPGFCPYFIPYNQKSVVLKYHLLKLLLLFYSAFCIVSIILAVIGISKIPLFISMAVFIIFLFIAVIYALFLKKANKRK